MNAVSTIERAESDEIRLMMPGIGEAEHEARTKLRSLRNTASALIASTTSRTARQLAWIASDYLTDFLFAPASLTELEELRRFVTRLMLTAIQAEQLADEGIVE